MSWHQLQWHPGRGMGEGAIATKNFWAVRNLLKNLLSANVSGKFSAEKPPF